MIASCCSTFLSLFLRFVPSDNQMSALPRTLLTLLLRSCHPVSFSFPCTLLLSCWPSAWLSRCDLRDVAGIKPEAGVRCKCFLAGFPRLKAFRWFFFSFSLSLVLTCHLLARLFFFSSGTCTRSRSRYSSAVAADDALTPSPSSTQSRADATFFLLLLDVKRQKPDTIVLHYIMHTRRTTRTLLYCGSRSCPLQTHRYQSLHSQCWQ